MPGNTPVKKTPQDLQQELDKKMSVFASKTQEQAAKDRARKLNLPFSNLTGMPIDPDALSLLPEDVARSAHIAIIYRNGSSIIAAVTDPTNPETETALEALKKRGLSIKLMVVSPNGLDQAFKRYETIKTAETFELGAIDIKEEDIDRLQGEINSLADLKSKITQVSITELLEILIAGALKTQASDIHFEPEPERTRLRYRLDGLLHDVTTIDHAYYLKALSRIKVLSKLKLNIHNAPQDGRFTIRQKDLAIEVRVSILPSEYGETIVMRLLDPRTIRTDLESLGMRNDILEFVKKQLEKPNGSVLTTGPTGSGKTTTLYAFINHLNTPDMKIITVEDPIEYHIKGISQTQIDPERGYTFASGLRAIVRQDPDIILIGEIRDLETADIALHAALTGHLVLSTIHTNDAAGTIPRLVDLGIKPETIAPAISMAMGQRLLRRLCENCKHAEKPSDEDLKKVKEYLDPIQKRFSLPNLGDDLKINVPGSCTDCNGLGYKGRVGVYEVFAVTRDMERLITSNPSVSDIRDLAVKEGMVTMLQDGYLKLVEGITSLDEIRRILG